MHLPVQAGDGFTRLDLHAGDAIMLLYVEERNLLIYLKRTLVS